MPVSCSQTAATEAPAGSLISATTEPPAVVETPAVETAEVSDTEAKTETPKATKKECGLILSAYTESFADDATFTEN